jgi:transposase-like protein
MYDIKTAADIQEALKDLLGGTIQSMLEAELDEQVEEREEADPEYHDSRNGYKPKTLRSSMGEIPIRVPQDRNSDFEPQVVPKYKKNISEIEGKIRLEATLQFRDVRSRDERGADFGADQGHLWV